MPGRPLIYHEDVAEISRRSSEGGFLRGIVLDSSSEHRVIILSFERRSAASEPRGFDSGLNRARVLDIESRRHARQRRCPIELSIRKDRLKFDKGFGRKYGYLRGDSVRFAAESSKENRKESPARILRDNPRKGWRRLFVNAENYVSITRTTDARRSAIVIA